MTRRPTPTQDLFSAFVAFYGAQKVGAMWADTDRAVVIGTWAAELEPFSLDAVRAACRDALNRRDRDGDRVTWPPTLPEFLDLVEARQRALDRASRPSLAAPPEPPPSPLMPPDKARAALAGLLANLRLRPFD